MRKSILLLFSALIFYASQAQFKQIAEGPAFEEPGDGLSKITQLKDGGCIYLLYKYYREINIQCYDKKHKQTAETQIPAKEIDQKDFSIDGIYGDSTDLILLINVYNREGPSLRRVKIDGRTGKLKENKEIKKIQPFEIRKNFASAFGGDVSSRFYYSRKPDGNRLAITSYNPFLEDINKRIEITLFDSSRQEIASSFFKSPNTAYNFVEVVDIAVVDNSKVFVLAYAYNKINSEKDCALIMVALDADTKKITAQELEHSKNKILTGCIMRFNSISKKLIILSTSKSTRKDKYQEIVIANFDPHSYKIDRMFEPYPVHANEKCEELFGKKNSYNGMPQNLYINDDGSFNIVYEEMTNIIYEHGVRSNLGHLAVSQFDNEGREGNSYFIPKIHTFITTSRGVRPFYQAKWNEIGSDLTTGDQYKPFAYLNGKKKNYVLINDIEENGRSALKGKITTIFGVGDCNAFYFTTSGTEVLPERRFIFGEPADRRENNLALLSISDYDRERNIYVTLKLEKDGRKKQVKLVWLEPR